MKFLKPSPSKALGLLPRTGGNSLYEGASKMPGIGGEAPNGIPSPAPVLCPLIRKLGNRQTCMTEVPGPGGLKAGAVSPESRQGVAVPVCACFLQEAGYESDPGGPVK